MQVYHEEILQTCFEKLVEDLEPNPVMRYLYQKRIITEEDMDAIRSNDTRYKMNDALILQLNRKGPNAFKRFVEGLQKNQPFLADILLDEEKKRLKEIQNITLNSASTSHSASELGETDFQGKDASQKDISVGNKYRDILNRAWRELRNALDPANLFPDLLHSGVLDFKDIEGIRRSRKNSREEAVDDLWQILHTKGPKAFEVFKKVLQKVQPELAIHLETEDMETQRNQQRPRTADVRKENQKLKMELEKERESHKKTKEEFDRLKSHKGYR